MAGRPPIVFKQPNRPTLFGEVGDFWIDPDRDNLCQQCVEVVVGPTGERNTTWKKLGINDVFPPSDTVEMTIVLSGTTPDRSIKLVVTDTDGSTHTLSEIVY